MTIDLNNKHLRRGVLALALIAASYNGGKYWWYKDGQFAFHIEKHTQSVQLIQIKTNSAGRPCWVLARDNREIFEMEFDNDVPNIGQGVRFRDIIYVDDSSTYKRLVKIVY